MSYPTNTANQTVTNPSWTWTATMYSGFEVEDDVCEDEEEDVAEIIQDPLRSLRYATTMDPKMWLLRAMQLAWWPIAGYSDDAYDPHYKQDRYYEKRGWLGLTVTNMSVREHDDIKTWFDKRSTKDVFLGREDECDDSTKLIGGYDDTCYGMWFSTPELREDFVAFLNRFPPRDRFAIVSNLDAARDFLKDDNYRIIEGTDASAVAVSVELSEEDFTLLHVVAV